MTVNSIGYITKKHFRSVLSIFVVLLTVAVAALSGYLAVMKGFQPGFAAFAGFAALAALFSAVSLFSVRIGCTLLRYCIAINAIVSFFTAMGMFTLGYLFFRHSGTQDRINELLSSLGYNTIATQPNVTGILLFAGSILLYVASACAFFGHRYLGAARTCASGTLKRSGFRVFPVISVVLFLFASGAAVIFLALSGDSFIDQLLTDRYAMLTALLIVLLLLHLLFSGICASAFARRSFAFKVVENRVMKVETNADGTVYVPINEDIEPGTEEPLLPTKKKESHNEKPLGKQFIREYSPAAEENAENGASGEGKLL